ncbi:MAG: PepSY domain-containing protein [Saprospiraceae bacterium]
MDWIKKYVKSLRTFRVWHRYLGLILLILILISSITGVLLAWKKNVETLQPSTQKGVSKELSTWKSIDEIAQIAQNELVNQYPEETDNAINRIDVRPSKGIAKVLFKKNSWEVQVDGTDGTIKSIGKRHADWIESLHDGSIISDLFKLISMNVLGFGLIFMLITGYWLWYAPRKIRKMKKS